MMTVATKGYSEQSEEQVAEFTQVYLGLEEEQEGWPVVFGGVLKESQDLFLVD